jgi:phosphatase NudJ
MGFYIGCGMVLAQGDKFVLVQETPGSAKQGLYNLPAGTLELNEDIIGCIIREVREETGVSVKPDSFIGVYQLVMKEKDDNVLFCMFAGKVADDAVFHSDEHEVIHVFSYDEIVSLDAAGKLRAPTIVQSIDEYRAGRVYPLSMLHPIHMATLPSIVVNRMANPSI